ncbi:MAG: hypothetical protein JWN11_845 [Hyphomicrobiales bacterium]|nr:hypothetical protein [Hyphomicrobiales bacterium]
MDNDAIETELLNLERQYWQSMKDKDSVAGNRLTDFPVIITGAQGVGRLDEATISSMMNSTSWSLDDFELDDDVELRMLSDSVAILAYKVREDLTVDGKPVSLEAADASVWVRRDGGWRCAMHTESLLGDPFGRDRQAAQGQAAQ